MKDLNEFEREYFLQTRREIDTEKKERDALLNFAVGVIGVAAFGVLQNDKMDAVLRHDFTRILAGCVLLLITSLMWVRRKKLQQIADRWYALRNLMLSAKSHPTQRLLEDAVCEGLDGRAYTVKDTVVCLALSLPMYCLLLPGPSGIVAVTLHIALCILVFVPRLKNRIGTETTHP